MEANGLAGLSLPVVASTPMLRTPDGAADPDAIGQAFESMFATLLIKQMRESLEDGLFGNDPGDVLGGLFDHYLGGHMAASGGFGIGAMIRRQLEMQTASGQPS